MEKQAIKDYRDPPEKVKEELNELREKDPNSVPENLRAAAITAEDYVVTAASQQEILEAFVEILADQEILEEVVHVEGASEINVDAKDGELEEELGPRQKDMKATLEVLHDKQNLMLS